MGQYNEMWVCVPVGLSSRLRPCLRQCFVIKRAGQHTLSTPRPTPKACSEQLACSSDSRSIMCTACMASGQRCNGLVRHTLFLSGR